MTAKKKKIKNCTSFHKISRPSGKFDSKMWHRYIGLSWIFSVDIYAYICSRPRDDSGRTINTDEGYLQKLAEIFSSKKYNRAIIVFITTAMHQINFGVFYRNKRTVIASGSVWRGSARGSPSGRLPGESQRINSSAYVNQLENFSPTLTQSREVRFWNLRMDVGNSRARTVTAITA